MMYLYRVELNNKDNVGVINYKREKLIVAQSVFGVKIWADDYIQKDGGDLRISSIVEEAMVDEIISE